MSEGRRDPDFPNPRPAQSPITTPTPDALCERLTMRSIGLIDAGPTQDIRAEAARLIQQQQATIERLSAALRGVRMRLIRMSDGGDPAADDGVDFIDEVLGDRAALGKDASDDRG